jgi:hypothetical protein
MSAWVARDPDAAMQWMMTLPENERQASAAITVVSGN